MPNANEILSQMSQSNWLKGRDIQGKNVKVKITKCEIGATKRDEKEVPQFVLHFHGTEKKLGLNVGNTQTMIDLFGEESDDWAGNEVILYTVTTQDRSGKAVPGVRIKSTKPEETVSLEETTTQTMNTEDPEIDLDKMPF